MVKSNTNTGTEMKIIAEKYDRNEWDVTTADGEWLGTLSKEKPTRFSISRGCVADRNADWQFTFVPASRGLDSINLDAVRFRDAMIELSAILSRLS